MSSSPSRLSPPSCSGGRSRAFAKDCNPKVLRTDATLNPDGTMDVVEQFTFDFASGCHGGIREINSTRSHAEDTLGAGNYFIGPITVTENGVPQPIAEQRAGFVRWGDANVTVSGHPHVRTALPHRQRRRASRPTSPSSTGSSWATGSRRWSASTS